MGGRGSLRPSELRRTGEPWGAPGAPRPAPGRYRITRDSVARMPALVRVERKRGCAWVTLDRPPLNLIVPELIAELKAAFDALSADPAVRVAVVTGHGRAMTAGMQVQALRDLTPSSAKALISALHAAIHALHESRC